MRVTRIGSHEFRWGSRTYVMGIVNVTPDSFSGDGVTDLNAALAQARQMEQDGADLIDIGGESTRPETWAGPGLNLDELLSTAALEESVVLPREVLVRLLSHRWHAVAELLRLIKAETECFARELLAEVRAEILLSLCTAHRMEGNGTEALRLGRMAVEEAAAA